MESLGNGKTWNNSESPTKINKNIKVKGFVKVAKVNSLMMAIVLTANFIAILFSSLGFIEEGLLPVLLLTTLLLSYVTAIFKGYRDFRLNKKATLLILLILSNFAFTFLFRGLDNFTTNYFIEFLAFGILAYLFTLLPFNANDVIRFTMLVGCLILLNPIGFLENNLMMYSDAMKMGATYAILPSVLAAIVHFFFMGSRINIINLIGYISNFYLLFLIITEGSRGAVLSIFLLVSFIIYIKVCQKFNKEDGILFPLLFAIILFLLITIIINLERIFLWLYDLFQSIGIELVVLIKSADLLEQSGVVGILNGREHIYENSFRIFMESPIWGKGIGIYADMYDGQYPHNIFLQLLAEGGFVFIIPFGILIILCFKYIVSPWSNDKITNEIKYLVLVLFLLSVPRLMFSIYLWQLQAFWLLLFIFLSVSTYKKTSAN
ncbi:O-antigen ligase family protein [Virgibacillus oceani]